jgi:hypothetical protein
MAEPNPPAWAMHEAWHMVAAHDKPMYPAADRELFAVRIAQALADERQARDEHWAKEAAERSVYESAALALLPMDSPRRQHHESRRGALEDFAAAIRAKGEVK